MARVVATAALTGAVGVAAIALPGTVVHRSPGNVFSAATIVLGDDDGGLALFGPGGAATTLLPGETVARCVEVVLESDARAGRPEVLLHASGPSVGVSVSPAVAPDLADVLELTVERGPAPATPREGTSCGEGFRADGIVYRGTLAGFLATHGSSGAGAPTGPWVDRPQGDAHVFRFTVRVPGNRAASGAVAGPVTFVWTTART